MNTGTKTPLRTDHVVTGDGDSRVTKLMSINDITIRGIPVICEFEIKFAANAVTTFPILDALNIDINADANKINTRVLPISSNEWPRYEHIS